jgi:hypothetical protein
MESSRHQRDGALADNLVIITSQGIKRRASLTHG